MENELDTSSSSYMVFLVGNMEKLEDIKNNERMEKLKDRNFFSLICVWFEGWKIILFSWEEKYGNRTNR